MAFLTYKIKSVTVHGGAVESVQNISIAQSGNSFDIQGDGNLTIEDTFVDSEAADITITVVDQAQIETIGIGDGGILVIVLEERVGADGAAAGADKTATFAAARVTDKSTEGPSAGEGGGSLSLRAAGPNNTAVLVWS